MSYTKVLLHDVQIDVWCTLSARRIIGQSFYAAAVNSERYMRHILHPFIRQLTDEGKFYGHFQQDSAIAHTVDNSMQTLNKVCLKRVMSHCLWPPHSPSITPIIFSCGDI